MNYSDVINGLFEGTGALMMLFSVRAILRDKQIKGFHWIPTVFFTSWSVFNLWFYPSNALWWSFAGGCMIFAVNTTWLSLVLYYSKVRNNG